MTAAALLLPGFAVVASATPPPLGSPCTITGTNRPDTLNGTAGTDVLCGFGGDDTINGLGGDDLLVGGGGLDTLNGGDGSDELRGGNLSDVLRGDAGNDFLYGGGAADDLDGGAGNDKLVGAEADDVLAGDLGADEILGQAGADTITGGANNDQLVGGLGNDDVRGGTGIDRLYGEVGDDDLYGDEDNDRIFGGAGNDEHFGGAGDDVLLDRDGIPYVDNISCGDGGADVAFVDSFDVVSCERTFIVDRQDPVAVNDGKTVPEDAIATTVPVLANDTDADGGTLKIISVTQPPNGTVVRFDRRVTYRPNADYCNKPPGTAPDRFRYTLNGGSIATVSVAVTCVDDAPVAAGDTATVAEDDPATTIDVLANDSDIEGDPFTIDTVTQPANGTVAITNSGANLTYEPDAGYCDDDGPTDDFSYTLAPGGDTATVAVTVACVDGAPVAGDDTAGVDEDDPATTIDVLANDTDPEGDPFTIDAVTQPANGTVAITNGGADLSYQPDGDYCNDGTPTDGFTYTLTPGGDTATVEVTVACVADAPTAVDDTRTVAEDDPATTINVLGNDTDPDGGPIAIDVVTQPTNGTVLVTNAGADLTYEPDADYCNDGGPTDDFTYTLAPGGDTATVRVTVTCADNDPPVAIDDLPVVDEDDPATTVDVLANDTDPENDPFTIDSVTQPANGTVVVTNAGADLTYEPHADYCNVPGPGADPFTYTLTPGGDVATVAVQVLCAPDAPNAVADTATLAEDDPATTIAVLTNDSDAENDPFTIDSVTQPAHGTVVVTNGGADLTYAPHANYCNGGTPTDDFTYTLTPGGDAATVAVTVTCANDAPVIAGVESTALAYTENAPATVVTASATVTDVDSANLAGGVLTVDYTAGGTSTDRLEIRHQGTGPGEIGVSGSTVSFGGTAIATFVGGAGNNPMVITLNVNATPTAVQALARAVTFRNATDNPATANRTVRFVLTDGDGGTSAPATRVIMVAATNDAPVIGSIEGAALAYTENDPATVITATGTVTDADLLNYAGGTVTADFSVGGQAEDRLEIRNQGTGAGQVGVSGSNVTYQGSTVGSFTGGTGTTPLVVTFLANANSTVVQAVLRNITYRNISENPATANRTARFVVTDGDGGTSAAATRVITVTRVDDPPVAVDDSTTFTQDQAATAVLVLTNDTNIDAGPRTITTASDPAHGTVVLTGGTPGAFSGLTYQPDAGYCNTPPGSPLDTFTYTLNGGSTATVSVTVTCEQGPVIDGFGNTTVAYTENDAATPLMATANVSDADSSNFDTGTLTVDFSAGGQAEDRLEVRNQGTGTGQIGVSGSTVTYGGLAIGTFTGGSGTTPLVITLNVNGTPSRTTALVRNITYRNVSDNPSATNRTARFVLTDGDGGTSAPATRAISVTPVNDAPVIGDVESTALAYPENAAGTPITASATVTEPDVTNFDTGTLTVDFSAGGQAEDRLEVRNQGTGFGQIGVSGSTITYGGLAFATFTGGTGTSPLVVTFNVNGTPSRTQALVRNITYRNVSDNPSGANRTARFVLTDGDGGTSAPATRVITVAPADDAPVVANLEGADLAYAENAAATVVTATATVADVDSADFGGGSLSVNVSSGVQSEDRLEIRNQGTGAGQIGVSGSNVTYQGATIGSFTGGTGGTALVISLLSNTNPVVAQALVRNITYRNIGDDPSTPKNVRFVLTDGDGGTSPGVARAVTITTANDAPSIADPSGATTYTEGGAAALVSPGLVLTDPDSSFLTFAKITISSPLAGDQLTFTSQNGITASFPSAGVMDLSGGATRAQYETALRSVGFRSTNDVPGTSRSIGIFVTDGSDASNTLTRTVTVVPVNDAPVVTVDSGPFSIHEQGIPQSVSPNLMVTDDGASLAGATVSLVPFQPGGVLSLASPPPGATASFDGSTGVLTIAGSATLAQYQAALRQVKFRSTTDGIVPDNFAEFVVSDGALSSTPKSRKVHVSNVNDLPVVADSSPSSTYVKQSATPAKVAPGVTISDPDDDNMQGASVTITGMLAGDQLTWTNQPGITGTMSTSSLLTFTGTSSKANYEAALRSVGFTSTSANPGTSRTFSVKTQDASGFSNVLSRTVTITP